MDSNVNAIKQKYGVNLANFISLSGSLGSRLFIYMWILRHKPSTISCLIYMVIMNNVL